MIQVNNLHNNQNMQKIASLGCYEVFEHQKDLSVAPTSAAVAYFMQEMNCRKRQVLCNLNGNSVKVQAGAMQWTAGRIHGKACLSGQRLHYA